VFQGEATENGKQAGSRSPLATALPGSQELVAEGGRPEPKGVGVPLGVAVARGVRVGTAVGLPAWTGLVQLRTPMAPASMTSPLRRLLGRSRPLRR
jgi:hypothetical protein